MKKKSQQITLTICAECILTGGPVKLINALKKKLTLSNPKYQAAKKYGRWVGKSFPQKLYFFKERKAGFFMPRGFAKEAVIQCIDLLGIKPEIIDKRRELDVCDFKFKGTLRDYQHKAVQGIVSRDFGVLEAGTGSGKTIVALSVIAERKQPTIIIVHTKELLYQWAERIEDFMGIPASLIGDGNFEIGPITVAIVNSASNHINELPENFGQVIVDECHRVPASLFTNVVTCFDAKYSLGLSATAYRRETVLTQLIYFYMGSRSHRIDDSVLHESGAILRPEIKFQTTGFYYKYRDDYAAMMTALTLDEARNIHIADDVLKESTKSDGILIVSDRVAHCQRLAELIEEKGGKVAVLTGKVSTDKRSKIVKDIKSNTINILISTMQLIGEGFDAPGLSTLFLATPIKFSGRLKQVVGRILRPADGKQARAALYP